MSDAQDPLPHDDHGAEDAPAGTLAKALLAATPFLLALLVWWLLRMLA